MRRKSLIKRNMDNILHSLPYKIITLYGQQSQSLNNIQYPILKSLSMPAIKQNIERIKLTAAEASCGVLANNQVNKDTKLFVINKSIQQHKKWICQQYKLPKQYQCYINSSIIKGSDPTQFQQISVSFPFIQSKIWRFGSIIVKYLNQQNETVESQLKGYKAAAFQQAWDYSMGRHILDWRLHQGNIKIQQDIKQKLIKTTSVLEQYSKQIKNMLHRYPKLAQIPKSVQDGNIRWLENRGASEPASIEEDYIIRIHKHYRKEMLLLLERFQNNLL